MIYPSPSYKLIDFILKSTLSELCDISSLMVLSLVSHPYTRVFSLMNTPQFLFLLISTLFFSFRYCAICSTVRGLFGAKVLKYSSWRLGTNLHVCLNLYWDSKFSGQMRVDVEFWKYFEQTESMFRRYALYQGSRFCLVYLSIIFLKSISLFNISKL